MGHWASIRGEASDREGDSICSNAVEGIVKRKLLLATIASVVGVTICYFLIIDRTPKQKVVANSPDGGFTLFGGIGQSGAPGSKPKVEFSLPTRKSYTIDGRSFDLEGLTVAQYVEKWRAKARSDNAVALHLYQAEALCAHADEYKSAGDMMAGSPSEPMYRQIIKDTQEVCDGTSPALMYERYQFLRQAAAAGVDEARIAFFLEGPVEFAPGTPILPSTEVPGEWAKQAVSYLQTSAAEGNRAALYYLSEIYNRGALSVSANPQQGLAYTVAAMALRPDGDTLDLMQLPAVQRSGLTPDQQAAAVQQGKALAAQSKGRHS
jgi:hypothetical protein